MFVLFLYGLALPLKLDIASGEYQPCENSDTSCRHQIVRQEDPSDLEDINLLSSPSPDDWWFQFVDFYNEKPNSGPDILEPSPSPNYYYPATMPPAPPENFHSQLCIEKVSKPFSLWNELAVECKEYLYKYDNRWHDNAMRLEREDAERHCYQGPQKLSIYVTFAKSMLSDLQMAMSQSVICTGNRLDNIDNKLAILYDTIDNIDNKLAILYKQKLWIETHVGNWLSDRRLELEALGDTVYQIFQLTRLKIPILITFRSAIPLGAQNIISLLQTNLGPTIDNSVDCREHVTPESFDFTTECTVYTLPQDTERVCKQFKHTLNIDYFSENEVDDITIEIFERKISVLKR